ncbi:MAG TPA: hypothetical protein VM677_28305 [Actinokineospora sp.]|jgi:hypothetical protein|nr:hypothetical protein [Actinokineospora sp.]
MDHADLVHATAAASWNESVTVSEHFVAKVKFDTPRWWHVKIVHYSALVAALTGAALFNAYVAPFGLEVVVIASVGYFCLRVWPRNGVETTAECLITTVKRAAEAIAFGKALLAVAPRRVWVVWSASQVAVFHVDQGLPQILWRNSEAVVHSDAGTVSLIWPDLSRARFTTRRQLLDEVK